MWFVFPQLAGLGRSSTARLYGIRSIDEARAYLAHPLLRSRLDLCTRIVLASESSSLHAIFGSPDDRKFRSCMTLFSLAADGPDNPYCHALDRWCGNRSDEQTLALIGTLLHGSAARAKSAPRIDFHVRRTYSGRPSSSMRFSEATAMATSVVCRPSVRERSASPITRL
jgi:uncharacterized protein (DUF1810 family)